MWGDVFIAEKSSRELFPHHVYYNLKPRIDLSFLQLRYTTWNVFQCGLDPDAEDQGKTNSKTNTFTGKGRTRTVDDKTGTLMKVCVSRGEASGQGDSSTR